MRIHITKKWERWLEGKPRSLDEWAINYIRGYPGWFSEPPKPGASWIPSEGKNWETNRAILRRYLSELDDSEQSHLFFTRMLAAWRAKQQSERDDRDGVERPQLLVKPHTLKIAKQVAKHKGITIKAALESMLEDSVLAVEELTKDVDSLKKSLRNQKPAPRVSDLEKDLKDLLKSLDELLSYSESHLKEFCKYQVAHNAENPELTPEQHDRALDLFEEKRARIRSILLETSRVRARHKKS
ncbi:hypothetical protein [Marinimicrobium sp. ARAG 43.8]|uniref:hypothetical protein n=1 Tax=Marinimicrobium sp. ARAG 43.8 TaxID=3418719 RepID=UPI003CE67054